MKNDISPFVKWAGGKRQLLPTINENLPKDLINGDIKKYIEPFVGGGALLFHLMQRYEFQEIIINDYNTDLINLYRLIKYDVNKLIEEIA